jgi:hypothetical protein
VIEPLGGRLALALPVDSRRGVVAATHVVLFLLRLLGRAELNLLRIPPESMVQPRQADPGAILFVATPLDAAMSQAEAHERLERIVRAEIERQYGRQGLLPIAYDLQIL